MSQSHSNKPFARLGVERLEDRVNPTNTAVSSFVDGVVLVSFAPGQEAAALSQLNHTGLTTSAQHIGFGVYKVNLNAGVVVAQAATLFSGLPGIRYAEPDYIEHTNREPNDPRYQSGEMWGLHNIGQDGGTADADVDAPEGWDLGTGSNRIVVAVIDSGVDYTHPDLAANIWRNTREVAGNGVDDDGNGFVDDMMGWDFVGGDANPDPEGDSHGTHVAGTIGAVGNNGIGVTGVAWAPQIMILRTLGPSGGSISSSIQAINYAVANGARILNNSYGGTTFSQARQDAIVASAAAGVIFVAAAGNETNDNDADPRYPVGHNSPNVVGVAATNRNDDLASFSNWGQTTVMVGAPGEDILSTVPGGGYELLSGTSMASPMVAGVLATFWDANPTLSYLEVIEAMKRTVDRLPGLNGRVITGGRINLGRLMQEGGSGIFATGADAGGGPHVKVYDGPGRVIASFFAYDQNFTGGVRVATGDVNGDRHPDIITVAGPTGGPHVKVFDGQTFQEIFSFYAFESTFTGGLTVAAGDVNGDGRADIIIGADKGGGPRVSVFSLPIGGTALVKIADFYAYDPTFNGGVRVAAGLFSAASTQADIVVAPGSGGGPHVRRFTAASVMAYRPVVAAETMVGDPNGRNGLYVAAGDMDGDGLADVIAGAGSGTPVVTILNGRTFAPITSLRNPFSGEMFGLLNPNNQYVIGSDVVPGLNNGLLPPGSLPDSLTPTNPNVKPGAAAGYMYGVRVAAMDLNGDDRPELILSGGPNDAPTVAVFNGLTFAPMRAFYAYDPSFYGGVYVGATGV